MKKLSGGFSGDSATIGQANARGNNRKIRVLFPFVGDTLGGSHMSALDLVARLGAHGVDPLVILESRGLLSEYLDELGIQYTVLYSFGDRPPASRVHRLSFLIGQWKDQIARFNADIVHTNDGRMHAPWLMAKKVFGYQVVWHQRTAISRKRLASVACMASQIITISDFVTSSSPQCVQKRAIQIPDPIEFKIRPDRGEAKRRLGTIGISAGLANIFAVGNLTPQKRPHFAVQVLAAVRKRWAPEAQLVLIGEEREPAASWSRALAEELEVDQSVHFLGLQKPVEYLLPGADVLLAPSVREGLGRNIVEAMLSNVPVVASNSGAHPEIIAHGDSGLLFESHDTNAAADLVGRVLSQPGLRATLQAGGRQKTRTFDADLHARRVLKVYREVTNT